MRVTPKNSCRISANQNGGIERPKNEAPVARLSNFEYWRSAEMMPTVTPTEIVMRKANPPRISVLASALWMSGATSGRRDERD